MLDEVTVRRLPAPREVMADQLRHLAELAEQPKITVRVLPVDARIAGYVVPRSAFALYSHPDPRVVAVGTVSTDVVLTSLTGTADVDRYAALYQRLTDAGLPPEESRELLVSRG